MNTISLCTSQKTDFTLVSNIFIDRYMPGTNGAYVKVYLYLLRCLLNPPEKLSITFIADRLDETEKDIIRAVSYWEHAGLIQVTYSSEQEIIGINFVDLTTLTEESPSNPSAKQMDTPPVTAAIKPELKIQKFDKPTYTQSQIETMTSDDEIKWLLNVVEIYLERLLKPADMQLILYLYESIGFSAELIMYLYEYCVSKSKKNASYIEAVALSWANEGIDTVEKAEAATTLYNSNYNAVNHAFGLNRMPGNVEKQFINKWIHKYSFSIDVIVEACNRTLLRTGKPDFKYADKILENWFKKQVKTLDDIAVLDQAHTATSKQAATQKPVITTQNKPSNNKFTAFSQRSYTKEDFSKMEQHLLNKK